MNIDIPYEVLKALYPIKTTAKAGVNVHELVKEKFPKIYDTFVLSDFDWDNDLDGILDFLYGERNLGLISFLYKIDRSNVTDVIKLIESNSEVEL